MSITATEKVSPLARSRARRLGPWRRYAFLVVGDSACIALAVVLAVLFSDVDALLHDTSIVLALVGLGVLCKLPVFHVLSLYRVSWRHVALRDLLTVACAVTLGSAAFGALLVSLNGVITMQHVHTLVTLDFLMSLTLVAGFRVSRRAYDELQRVRAPVAGKRILIVGAGAAGEQIVRAIQNDRNNTYLPVGFIDDDPAKTGASIRGVRVLGPRSDMARVCKEKRVDELLVAIPSADGSVIRETVRSARAAGLRTIRTLPPMAQLFSRHIGLAELRDIQPEDLLRRRQVTVDTEEVCRKLRGAVVLVTGAGGSIGSELCHQIARFSPRQLVLFERDETSLFDVGRHLGDTFRDLDVRPALGDICDRGKVDRVFALYRPQIVFHAAAFKHVPMMEANPIDSVLNNVVGTRVVGEASEKYQAERFVLISTDKAVNPSSIMGATKRLAEAVVQDLNRNGKTRFMAVRFGNVLGSRGSVIPIFKEQIKAGGPVTVTHPEMRRYFMTPSEAVLLVIQAGTMGDGGEVFVLDMGEPVNILDLARDMIHLAGLEPDVDVPIVFTGVRPGEKLFEDILTAEEGTRATRHDKVFVARTGVSQDGPTSLVRELDALEEAARSWDQWRVMGMLQRLVPTYHPLDQQPAATQTGPAAVGPGVADRRVA